MITNERQYRITKAQLSKLDDAIGAFSLNDATVETGNEIFARAQLEGLRSERQSIANQLAEYESLKAGELRTFEANSLEDLPQLLIKARIARGLSQRALATRLGLKEQQIQRYEAETYQSASLARIREVATALGLRLRELGSIEGFEPNSEVESSRGSLRWEDFPVAEMYRRGWFAGFCGSLASAKENAEELLTEFLGNVWDEPVLAFHRKQVRANSEVDRYALTAWECRVLTLASCQTMRTTFKPSLVTTEWLRELLSTSRETEWPQLVREHLHRIGIAFVVEPHLRQTYLDGAALLARGLPPVIGLTLRYDRLDNFWFVLLHEIGHLALHARRGQIESFFDDLDVAGDKVEAEADTFAMETSVSRQTWEVSVARYTRSVDAVRDLAEELGINPSIIAGRIRREANNYVILSELVGAGEVRKQFSEVHYGQ